MFFPTIVQHARRNLVAYLALFAALTSTGYAATTLLPRNSVGTRQVINRSLLKVDFKPGQLPRGARGPEGPAGDIGPAGIAQVGVADGPAGAMCAAGGGGCQVGSSVATCPSGSVVVGGGWTSDSVDVTVPFATRTAGNTWGVIAINYEGNARSIVAHAICAAGPGVSAAGAVATATQQSLDPTLSRIKARLSG